MAAPKVSVIIPVYNVERYLEKCLDSVLCQTLSPIELVCVNDGSTDSSPEILARYAAAHENLRVIAQENGGLSRARNAALDRAKGEYVFLLDSDDFLLRPDNLEALWTLAHGERLDMLRFCGESVNAAEDASPQSRERYLLVAEPTLLNGEYPEALDGQRMAARLYQNGDYRTSACFTLYRREFLEDRKLRFEPGIVHEDEVFSPICYAAAERVGCTDIRCYGRTVHQGSIMTSANRAPSVRGYAIGAYHLEAFRREHRELLPEFDAFLQRRISGISILAAKYCLDLPRAERGECFRAIAPGERARILRQLRPKLRQERSRRFRVAVKGRVPKRLWQFVKRMKR